MTKDSTQLDSLLNSIEENCSPAEYKRACLPFMFDCADLICDQLPGVARESLSIAKSIAGEQLQIEVLNRAVEMCWKALGEGPQSLQFDNPQVAGIRAVICILHSQLHSENNQLHSECDDFVELMSFYLQLLNNVEPSVERQEALLRKRFSGCL